MQQSTMLAIFAIALAFGLTTAMLAVPMMPQVLAAPGDKGKAGEKGQTDNACDNAPSAHQPFFC